MTNQIKTTNKELFVARAKAVINGYKAAKEIWKTMIYVAEEMEGKIMNKRYVDAVNERTKPKYGHIYVCKQDFLGHKEMQIFLKERYAEGVGYFDKDVYYTRWGEFENTAGVAGRINVEKIKEVASLNIERIDAAIAKWDDAARKFDSYQKKLNKALAVFGKAMDEINPMFRPTELHTYDWEKASQTGFYAPKK